MFIKNACQHNRREQILYYCFILTLTFLNPYSPNILFLHPHFQGVRKCYIGRIWVNVISYPSELISSVSFLIHNKQKQSLEVFCKKGVLKNSVNFTENTCVGVSFYWCFSVKRLKNSCFEEHLQQLLLNKLLKLW